jgi:uncharacterized protein (TIGR02246 family)
MRALLGERSVQGIGLGGWTWKPTRAFIPIGETPGIGALFPPMRLHRESVRVLVAAAALIAAAAATARAQGPPDSAAAAAAIAQAASSFSRALERGDARGMSAQYLDDATLVPPSGRLVSGREAILAFWTPRNPEFHTLEHSLATDRLEVSGDVAVEVGTWRQRSQLREEEPRESAGRYVVVWRRLPDGTWRMQLDTWTAPFPED